MTNTSNHNTQAVGSRVQSQAGLPENPMGWIGVWVGACVCMSVHPCIQMQKIQEDDIACFPVSK